MSIRTKARAAVAAAALLVPVGVVAAAGPAGALAAPTRADAGQTQTIADLAVAEISATVDVAAGNTLSVRDAPDGGATKVGSLPDGAAISVICSTTGTTHTGSQGTTDQWDMISTGYVSHAYVYSPESIPACSDPAPPEPPTSSIDAAIAWGQTQVGTRYLGCAAGTYRFGTGSTVDRWHDGRTCGQSRVYFQPANTVGYDCSGLMWAILQQAGINLEHTSSRSIKANVPEVPKDAMQPGDMLAKNGHVVMYIGVVDGVHSVLESTPHTQLPDGSYVGTRVHPVDGFVGSADYTAHRAPSL
ncbi:MAG: C40 family peptidase [Dermatophilaceae bacterium]